MSNLSGVIVKVTEILINENDAEKLSHQSYEKLMREKRSSTQDLTSTFKNCFSETESGAVALLKKELREHYSRFLKDEEIAAIEFKYDMSQVDNGRFWESSGFLSSKVSLA